MFSIRPSVATALVLVDLQRWIVAMPWAPVKGAEVVDACVRLRDGFAKAKEPTVLVRYLRGDGAGPDAAAERNQFVEELAPRPGEHVVTKNGLDAFEGTGLAEHLQGLGVSRLVLAGLSTAHGVAATAAAAVASGYDVVVVSDATASVSVADHRGALDQLARLGVAARPVGDVIGALHITGD